MTTTAASPHAIGVPGYTETLPCEPESAHRARLLVSTALTAWAMEELVEDGILIVSELLTNTIDHTSCRTARVMIQHRPSGLVRIGVADKFSGPPQMGTPGDDAVEGRGLLLVDAVSWRWGYDRDRRGKVVWAELRVPTEC
ncbi:ATP-binding protein [Streptomyces sp. UG1]|uniref:ATP-binding protein n=1 Tax=Streptomyces sp. UG1 TaxID=3417652 RepID=UPI003CF204E6